MTQSLPKDTQVGTPPMQSPVPTRSGGSSVFGPLAVMYKAMMAQLSELGTVRDSEAKLMEDTTYAKTTAVNLQAKATIAAGDNAADLDIQQSNEQYANMAQSIASGAASGSGLVASSVAMSHPSNMDRLVSDTNTINKVGETNFGHVGASGAAAGGPLTEAQVAFLKDQRTQLASNRFGKSRFADLFKSAKENGTANLNDVVIGECGGQRFTLKNVLESSADTSELLEVKKGIVAAKKDAYKDFTNEQTRIQTWIDIGKSVATATGATATAQFEQKKADAETARAANTVAQQRAGSALDLDKDVSNSQASLYQQAIDAQKRLWDQINQTAQAVAGR